MHRQCTYAGMPTTYYVTHVHIYVNTRACTCRQTPPKSGLYGPVSGHEPWPSHASWSPVAEGRQLSWEQVPCRQARTRRHTEVPLLREEAPRAQRVFPGDPVHCPSGSVSLPVAKPWAQHVATRLEGHLPRLHSAAMLSL